MGKPVSLKKTLHSHKSQWLTGSVSWKQWSWGWTPVFQVRGWTPVFQVILSVMYGVTQYSWQALWSHPQYFSVAWLGNRKKGPGDGTVGKVLWHEHEGLISVPWNPCKSQAWRHVPVIPVMAGQTGKDCWDLLAGQRNRNVSSGVSYRYSLKK